MNRQEGLRFEAKDEDFLILGSEKTNIKLTHYIAPQEFIKIYETVSGTYKLEISQGFIRKFYETITFRGKKREAKPSMIIKYLIDFILDTHSLMERGIEVKPLVQEFKKSSDMAALRHACSLAFLSSIYAYNEYDIEYRSRSKDSRNADVCINGIFADIKVIQRSDLEQIHREKGREFKTKLSDDLCYDIGKAIQNRLHDGIKQAELVFIDLSQKSLPSMWRGEEFDATSNIVPEPTPFRVVYFCKIGPNVFIGREQVYSFFATYIDMDPRIWDFIKLSDRIITHGLVGGPADIL
jgi:hypothetical protein